MMGNKDEGDFKKYRIEYNENEDKYGENYGRGSEEKDKNVGRWRWGEKDNY